MPLRSIVASQATTSAVFPREPLSKISQYSCLTLLRSWRDAERHLLNAAKAECSSFMEEAGWHMKLLEQTNLLDAPSQKPCVTIQLSEAWHINLVLRIPAPDRGRSRIEQTILRRYLTAAATS